MKALAAAVLLATLTAGTVCAQEPDRSLQRIAVELQRSPTMIRGLDDDSSDGPHKLGILTFAPPVFRGEFVTLSLPIGDLITRAVRGVAEAGQRREKEAARRRVEAELKAFTAAKATEKPHH